MSSTWQTLAEAAGVRARSSGTGTALAVLPGMEGDGSSCLHVVERVQAQLAAHRPVRVVLVDYAAEQHQTLAGLEATVLDLLRPLLREPAVVWGQSFGCLLAASVVRGLRARGLGAERLLLVSPFTDLPTSRDVAARLLPRIPRPIYRATAVPTCRWVFGPAPGGQGAAFLAALRDADPADVARRAGWLRGADQRSHFEGVLDETAAVWFGTRDRLIDLRGQLEVFTELMDAGSPGLVPHAGHVVLPVPAVEFLSARVSAWLTAP